LKKEGVSGVRIHRNMEKLKTKRVDHCRDRHWEPYRMPAVDSSGWLEELKVRIVRQFQFVGKSVGSFDRIINWRPGKFFYNF
jgi:hypothetical protein